jgi:secreted trypsin-like serine protease
VITAGWGLQEEHPDPSRERLRISSESLKTVNQQIHEQSKCKKHLVNSRMHMTWVMADIDQVFCASSNSMYEGTCRGDSGGPIMMKHDGKYYVVGIVSFMERCGRSYFYPAFYTRVSHYMPWIKQVMNQV